MGSQGEMMGCDRLIFRHMIHILKFFLLINVGDRCRDFRCHKENAVRQEAQRGAEMNKNHRCSPYVCITVAEETLHIFCELLE